MNHTILILLLLIMGIRNACNAQEKDPYEEKYEWRIRQEVLYNVYIPADVNDAILQLNKLIDEESKGKYRQLPEEEITRKLFFSLGRWITYNWSLYDGSRLSVYMRELGIFQPDDMAGFIMIAFHRSLNKKPLKIRELVTYYQEKEKKEKEERLKKGTILFEEKRQLEKPAPENKGGQ